MNDFNFGSMTDIYDILKSTDNNFISIWADNTASLSNGKMYISSSNSFNIVSFESNSIIDYYTETHIGEAGETLQSNDIIDVNVM